MLSGFEPHEVDPSTAAGAHRVLEALKLALADRDAHYGDPDPDGATGRAAGRPCSPPTTPPSGGP